MSTLLRHRRPAGKSIEFESLEARRLLAGFGTPWPNAKALSISFPADGVAIGSETNNLHATLDQISPRESWQELALRAFQTWAVHADINVAVRNDHNNDFGAPGLTTGDPRFGDFRIGAFPQYGVLANSLPFQTIAGSYSGDILLNSNETFAYHDWSSGTEPAPSTDHRDLFSLLLHEAGNSLGIDDNLLSWTVMYRQYTVPKGLLTQHDIDEIQALYGPRTDPDEYSSNDALATATLLPTPIGFQPASDVNRTRGSLVSSADVDYYELVPLAGQDEVTLRLRVAGISLLMSQFQVFDEAGNLLHDATAASALDNDHSFTITDLAGRSKLFVRVAAADVDVFSVGDYQLEVDYRSSAAQATDPIPAPIDGGPGALNTHYLLADSELGGNDTVATADVFQPAQDFASSQFELVSAVSAASDVDFLKLGTPVPGSNRLVIHVAGVGESPELRLRVVDHSGDAVGAVGRLRADGTWVLEVAQPEASEEYFLRVSVDPNSSVAVGNYVATAEYFLPSAQMNLLVQGTVSSEIDEFARWTAGKSRLYRFDLTALGDGSEGVQLTIYDAHTREIRAILSTPGGLTRSAFAWLAQGDYILRLTATSRSGAAVDGVHYALRADGISDDQDPDSEDPIDDPLYDPYDYDPNTPPNEDPPPPDPYYYYYEYYYQP